METEELIAQLHQLRAKVARFHARAVGEPERPPKLLEEALTELGVALEELRVTEEELRQQNDRLVGGIMGAESDLRHLEERFAGAPDALLETDEFGVILAANAMAGELLGAPPQRLVGKPLPAFVALEDRRAFRTRLGALSESGGAVRRWVFRLRGRTGVARQVDVRLRPVSSSRRGRLVWWSLRPTDQAALHLTVEPPRAAVAVTPALESDAEVALGRVVGIAATLFRAAGAGVMLADEQGVPRWVTGSDATARAFEDAQAELGQGPWGAPPRGAAGGGARGQATPPRWPARARRVAGQGVAAVLSAPLALDGKLVGSFNVFTGAPRDWTAEDAAVAETFAEMTVLLLRTRADLQEQQTLATQLQRALHGRVLIEQAKGVLMARHGLTSEQAWTLLRGVARGTSRRAADLAAVVVEEGDLPQLGR